MTLEELKQLALDCGFNHVGELRSETIEMHPEAREACAENKCRAYGKNWNCPPGCGTLEECEARVRAYKRGLIIQTTGELEDSMDYEGMMELAKNHKEHFDRFAEEVRKAYPGSLILGDGACSRCKECTYPDAPCRFPQLQSSNMEAYGMIVSEVCKRNDIPYYYGPGTLTYVGAVLVE